MILTPDSVKNHTRGEAIAKLTKLSERFPDACKSLGFPVYCTAEVWELIEAAALTQNQNTIVQLICLRATNDQNRIAIAHASGVEFTVALPGGSSIYRLYALYHNVDSDNSAPAITIAFPGEN